MPPLKGLRNGIYYGGKVRLVHSLIMTILFKDVNKHNLKQIVKMTLEHAKNLGKFVFLYKLTCILLEKVLGKTSFNNFLSGFIWGYFVWGHKTPVNYQIVLYLFSRIMMALVEMIYYKAKGLSDTKSTKTTRRYYHIFTALIWGIVMWIFEVKKSALQASLASSMEFLYKDSDEELRDWRELVPFYVPGGHKSHKKDKHESLPPKK